MSETGQPDRQRMSIVALGSFNPAIFHPVWFARHNLIREAEADSSQVKILSQDVTIVESEWFTLQVTPERFSLEARDPRKLLPLKDLVTGTFGILEHTPVRAFGFNSIQNFSLGSADAWHQFGHHFAPKQSWEALLKQPGLFFMTMQGTRADSSADRIQVSIQSAANYEIIISINEHFDVKQPVEEKVPASPSSLVRALEHGWGGFIDYSRVVGEHLLNEGGRAE